MGATESGPDQSAHKSLIALRDMLAAPRAYASSIPQACEALTPAWWSMFDSLPAAVFITDELGSLQYCNPSAKSIAGGVPPEIGTPHWCESWKHFFPDGRPMPHGECPMSLAVKQGRAASGEEIVLERSDGKRMWLRVHSSALVEESREVCGYFNMLLDITDKRRAENALAEQRRLYQLSMRLNQTETLESVMGEVMSAAAELLRADRCTAQLVDTASDSLRLVASNGFDRDFQDRFAIVTGDGFTTCAAALRVNGQIIVQDVANDPKYCELASALRPMGILSVMSTPVRSSKGSLLGMFTLYWANLHTPTEEELRLLDLYVQPAARLIERHAAENAIRLSESRLEAEVADLESLRQLAIRVATISDRTAALNEVLDTGIALVGAAKGNVQMYDAPSDTLRIVAHRGFDEEFLDYFKRVPAGYSCCGKALAEGQRVVIEDVVSDDRFSDLAEVYIKHGFRAVQSTPLYTTEGRLMGMFSTHFAEPRMFSERELRLLDQIAQKAGRIIERTTAEDALREHAQNLETLNRIGATLSAELDTEKVIQAVTDAGRQLSGAQFGAFFLNRVNEQDEAYMLYTLSGAPCEAFEQFGAPRKTPLFARTFDGEGVVRSDDITQDPRFGKTAPHHGMPQGHLPVRSYLAVPVISRSGEVLGGLFFGHPEVGVFTEQAERLVTGIAAQAAIAIDNASLFAEARESEARFRAMAENIPQLAWMAQVDGSLYWYNRRWYEYTGTTAESQDGWGWQSVHHPDFIEPVTNKWIAALKSGEPWEDTFPLRGADGQYRWFLSRAFPIRDERGNVVRWFGTNTDITAQREVEEELRRHRDKLQELVEERTNEILEAQQRIRMSERMASLGTLSAGLGHDMGNLLLPVRVHIETLESMDLPAYAREELIGIRSSIEYLRKLAGGLRQLAIDPVRAAGTESTEIRSWWAEASTVLKNALPRGIRLEHSLPETDRWVSMPKAALTQAVFNLVQNAGDALRQRGTGTVSVTISVVDKDSGVHVCVSDDGPGMTEEVRSRCMEPFFTSKTRGVSTGLGLALVYGLVQDAGGTIDLHSTPGNGTEFTLKLQDAQPPVPNDTPKRLAVLDVSEPRLRSILTAELRSLSYDTAFGRELVRSADLVVTDRPLSSCESSIPVILLSEPDVTRSSAIAIGKKPKLNAIREALRTVTGDKRWRAST